jgi:hypothetical protein
MRLTVDFYWLTHAAVLAGVILLFVFAFLLDGFHWERPPQVD